MKTARRVLCTAAVLLFLASPVHAQVKKVAIAGWGPHPSLDETIAEFKKGLAAEGFKVGDNLVFDEANVNFDRALVPQMLNKLAAAEPDLMLTIATPVSVMSTQQLRNRTFPIVFAPIADPVHARLVPSWTEGDKLMTGGSVALDYDVVLGFFRTMVPDLKRLAVLYDTGDDSSTAALDSMSAAAGKVGISIVKVGVDNPSELPQRVQSVAGRADALYPVASGRIQQGGAAIGATAARMKMPVLTTIPQMVQAHQALGAMAVAFGQSGEAAGHIAGRILKGASPQSIPAWRPGPSDHRPMISTVRLKALGLTMPAALAGCGCAID